MSGVTLTVSGEGGGGGRGRGMRDMDLGDLADEEGVARLLKDLEGTVKEWSELLIRAGNAP